MRQNRRIASGLLLGLMLLGGGASGAPSRSSAFSGQCRGDGFQIDIVDLDVVRIHDPDERIEQLRDWTWPILLARLEASAGLDGLLDGNALQPLLRDDAYAHVLDHPVGNARSGIAGDGTVVAMIAQGDPAAMREALLEAVDQQALFLGATPRRVIAYRYVLDERNAYMKLCRIGDLDAAWLEAEAQGFRRRTVRTAKELGTVLDGGVDLMTAQCTASGLEVTGRRRLRTGKAPITVEHVASLYQSIPRGYVPSKELGLSAEQLPDEQRMLLSEGARILDETPDIMLDAVVSAADLDPRVRETLRQIRAWKKRHPGVPTRELMLSWLAQQRELGFSLDHKIRAKDVIRSIDAVLAVLDEPSKLAALLYSWDVVPEDAEIIIQLAGLDGSFERSLRDLRRALEQSSDTEALGMVIAQPEFMSLFYAHDGYQCARYGGLRLQGTLPSMTLYYTDLLMKLWGNDQFDSAPEGLIPGFESVVGHELAAAHCSAEQRQYRATRFWLGLREEQYARAAGEEWRFAPVVTRVFAKSSEAGPEYGEEVEARADTQRFVRWWNARYGFIAAWEPQYELLNQLMKWSLVAQAARSSEHQGCLDFLDTVAVKRSHRFDTWVASTRDLRWRGPVTLVHEEDEPTECLPILRSRAFSVCGEEGALYGGVSLGSRAQVASKRLPRQGHPSELRRLEALSPEVPQIGPDGRVTYPSLSRADGTLKNVVIKPGKLFTARVDPARSQRGLRHIWSSGGDSGIGRSVTKWWSRVKGRLDVHAEIGDFGVGHLRADDVTGKVVRARITERAMTQARALGEEAAARRASGGASLDEIVANLPDVSKAWRVHEETVLVKLAEARNRVPKYGLMSSGGGIRGPPGAPTIRFSAGNGRDPGRTVEILLLSAAQAQQYQHNELAKGPAVALYSRLEAALARNDISEATNIIGQIRALDPMSHRLIMSRIAAAQGKAVREGKNPAALEKLLMREAIEHGRPTTPVRELNAMPADGVSFYLPRGIPRAQQYTELISLAPGVDPATPPSARPRFHARIVEEATRIASLPAEIRRPRGGAHSRGSRSGRSSGNGHAPDSPDDDYRRYKRRGAPLFGYPGRVYVIEPCELSEEQDDASRQRSHDAASVPCHGRSTARHAEAEARTQFLKAACEVKDPQYRKLVAKACKRLPARERNASPGTP